MKVAVRGFGPLQEVFSGGEFDVELPVAVGTLRRALESRWPELSEQRYSIAVDQQLIERESTVTTAKEIALLPPFAGG